MPLEDQVVDHDGGRHRRRGSLHAIHTFNQLQLHEGGGEGIACKHSLVHVDQVGDCAVQNESACLGINIQLQLQQPQGKRELLSQPQQVVVPDLLKGL
eukprot:4697429-Pyramimonas_sp.AAC.1